MAMSYAKFISELNKAGLSIRAFAKLVGMNPNSIYNYSRVDELPTHLSLIAVLIAELNTRGVDYRRVMAKVEIAPKKPRGGSQPGHFGGSRQGSFNFERVQEHG